MFFCGLHLFIRFLIIVIRRYQMNNHKILEFDRILEQLAGNALSDIVKARCLALVPSLNEAEVRRRLDETTQAKRIIEQIGTPPLPFMTDLQKVIDLIAIDAMLMPEQISYVASFLASCRRMKTYLKKAETTDTNIAWYGGSIDPLTELENEIERCIRNGMVDDKASARLADIRRKTVITTDQIKAKLEALLRKNKAWFSESFVSIRNGRYTLPVKRQHKNDVAGSVIDLSQTGGTCFIEPASVGRLQSELSTLQIEEDSEVRRILYSLTALISDYLPAIKLNIEAMETLDFLFAKGKLSLAMKAAAVGITSGREIRIINARHPLLNPDTAVPLNFEADWKTNGVIITGPNTGGKTVAIKTVGLLSLMVQSGLHIPADENSILGLRNLVLCDIGDGQSITDNLSTFSAHMKNIIEILRQANHESLVLLDELGSGTDPAEGMGLAIAILDELSAKKCLFVVTTHYPEIKEYAANKPGLINARMAFDKESLLPLYRLEIGEAGESCALYIAERLGMPQHILGRAQEAAYGTLNQQNKGFIGSDKVSIESGTSPAQAAIVPQVVKQEDQKPRTSSRSQKFNIGDSVIVYPQKETGIVYARANDKGEIGVQIKGKKKLINHKRIKLQVAASELYPDNYDFSIIFDSVATRKARHQLEKGHYDGIIILNEGEEK
jgi:dsDNA-specific endonuclease/ATPase MutS2